MSTYGELQRHHRIKRGLTTRAFGELVGTSGGYVTQLETGSKPPPNAAFVFKAATVLGVDPWQLWARARIGRMECSDPDWWTENGELGVTLPLGGTEDFEGPSAAETELIRILRGLGERHSGRDVARLLVEECWDAFAWVISALLCDGERVDRRQALLDLVEVAETEDEAVAHRLLGLLGAQHRSTLKNTMFAPGGPEEAGWRQPKPIGVFDRLADTRGEFEDLE